MATLLDEILSESKPTQINIGYGYGTSHPVNCNCVYCKKYGYRSPSPGGHKYWRVRRAERLCNPQSNSPVGKGIPGNIGALPPIITIGNRQRAALVKQWTQKLRSTKSPVAKQRYKKYITVILRRKRPSWHQSEKDLQLLLTKTNIPGQKKSYASIEIKNYNIQDPDAFIRSLANLNTIPNRKILLDFRGQNATTEQLQRLIKYLIKQTGLAPQNISAVMWKMNAG